MLFSPQQLVGARLPSGQLLLLTGRCQGIAIRQCGSYSEPSFSRSPTKTPGSGTALLSSSSSAWARTLCCWVTASLWPIRFWRHSYRPPPPAAEESFTPSRSDLALDYGSKPNDATSRRVGSYLMWVAIMTTCVTSSLFLTGASFNLLAAGFVEKLAHVELRWTDWFITAAPVIIPLLILIPLLTYWLYPPEVKRNSEVSKWAAAQLEKLGPLTRHEIILAGIVILSLVLWVAGGAYVGAATVALHCGLSDVDHRRC